MDARGSIDGALAEFTALRQEIDDRVRAQHQILTLQLTSAGAVFAFAISRSNMTALLLIVPMTSYLLCGRLMAQHYGTLLVAQYIREELSPRVPDGLGWEAWILQGGRRVRLQGSILPLRLTFPGTGLVALGWTTGLVFARDDVGVAARSGLVVLWLLGVAVAGHSAAMLLLPRMRSAPEGTPQEELEPSFPMLRRRVHRTVPDWARSPARRR